MASISQLVTQPLETSLNQAAFDRLSELRTANNAKLLEYLEKATKYLRDTAGEINDRGTAEREQHVRKLGRLAKDNLEEPEAEVQEFHDFQEEVQSITREFDLGARQTVDDRVWLASVEGSLAQIIEKAQAAAQKRSSRPTPQLGDDLRDEDEDSDFHPAQPNADESPSEMLRTAFSLHKSSWSSKSLTERYAKDNAYTDFYRVVHDAKHGDSGTPVPHDSLWFVNEERRGSAILERGSKRPASQMQADLDATSTEDVIDLQSELDSDVEIAHERMSIRCPITYQPFMKPLSSSKCPHSFEKTAIMDMITNSITFLPFTDEQLEELSQLSRAQERQRRERQIRVPMVKCPVCEVPLSQNDLRPDPALERKVKRTLEKERQDAEAIRRAEADADSGDEEAERDANPIGSQRRHVFNVGSSPPGSVRGRRSGQIMKHERESIVPQTQLDDDETEG